MNKKRVKIILSWIVVILWMLLIFKLSSQVSDKSDQLSTGITEMIVKTVNKFTLNTDFDIGTLNHYVRKNAHFFAYFTLGILALNALRRSKVVKHKSIAFLICVLYAISDEVHQIFVPGRGPQVKDVFIDSSGAFVGILVYLAISSAFLRRASKKRREHFL